jgi:anti-sigma B factor antagonist
MEISAETRDTATLVTLSGDLDGKTAPQAQAQIVPLCQPGRNLLLDMTEVAYMSSAGLRLLLLLHRQLSSVQGQMVLVGLSEELQDTMSATGFLAYFTTAPTREAGLAALP